MALLGLRAAHHTLLSKGLAAPLKSLSKGLKKFFGALFGLSEG